MALAGVGRLDEAIKRLNEALSIDGKRRTPTMAWGYLFQKGRFAERSSPIQRGDRGRQAKAERAHIWPSPTRGVADIYQSLGKTETAAEYYQEY